MRNSPSWYLIYTKPRQERTAEENLQRQNYQTYLPWMQRHQRRLGRYTWVKEPVFPRYLFILLDSENDNWGPIRSTRGVSTLVRFGGVPAKVPTDFIQFLQNNSQLDSEKKAPEFRPGDSVQILDGVMAGYAGIFEAKSGAKRVTLLLDVVGKATRVEVSADSIDFLS